MYVCMYMYMLTYTYIHTYIYTCRYVYCFRINFLSSAYTYMRVLRRSSHQIWTSNAAAALYSWLVMTAIVTTNNASTTIRVILQVVLYVNALYCAFVYFSQESFSNVIKNINSDAYNEIVVYFTVLIVLLAFIFPLAGYIIWGDLLTSKTVAYLYYHFLGIFP